MKNEEFFFKSKNRENFIGKSGLETLHPGAGENEDWSKQNSKPMDRKILN